MALPVPVRTSDHVRLASWDDPAFDLEATGSEAVTEYIKSDRPNLESLAVLDGEAPTVFVLRALSERELANAEGLATKVVETDEKDDDGKPKLTSMILGYERAYHILRWSLQDIENWGEWKAERVRECSAYVLSMACVESIPRTTAIWLAGKVRAWSKLTEEKKTVST